MTNENDNLQNWEVEKLEAFREDLIKLFEKYPDLFGTFIVTDFNTEITASASFGGSCMVCDTESLVNKIIEHGIQHTLPRIRDKKELH